MGSTKHIFQVASICVALSTTVQAQRHISHSRQDWLQLNLLFGREDAIGSRLDLSTRHVDGHPGMSQYLLRGGLTYGLPFGISAVTGLARIRYFDDGRASRNEWRPYHDLSRSETLRGTQLQQRLRTEARFMNGLDASGAASERQFDLRLRYRLQCQWTLANLSQAHPDRMLLLTFGDELMVNPVHGPSNRFYSANRVMLSPTLRWGHTLDIALVLNHQFSARSHEGDFESAEVLWLNITHRIARTSHPGHRRG
jgi:hypothetical protein